jgi:predicted transcriptional regulator
MPQPTLKPTDPWAALDALLNYSKEPEGEGWFTTDDYMKRYGVGRTAALRMLGKLATEGKLDHWEGNIAKLGRKGHKYRVKP